MLLTAFMLLTVLMFGLLITNIMFRFVVPNTTEDYNNLMYEANYTRDLLVELLIENNFPSTRIYIGVEGHVFDCCDILHEDFKPTKLVGLFNEHGFYTIVPDKDGKFFPLYIKIDGEKGFEPCTTQALEDYITQALIQTDILLDYKQYSK